MQDDDLRLTPLDDDEIGLAPIDDEKDTRPIAPDISVRSGERLIPVTCGICKTRMHAGESQVGLWKRCPDCDTLTEIRAVDPKFMLVADDPEAANGYALVETPLEKRPTFQIGVDYRTVGDGGVAQKIPQRAFNDELPLLDRLFDGLLKPKEEREKEKRVKQRETEMDAEIERIKKASREGRLEETLQSQRPVENAAKKADAAPSHPVSMPPLPPPPPLVATASSPYPASPPSPPVVPTLQKAIVTKTSNEKAAPKEPPSVPKPKEQKSSPPSPPSPPPILPKIPPGLYTRLCVLVVCGLVGNFFGEKARLMIWQGLVDRVYGQSPGHVYSSFESMTMAFYFWVGTAPLIVWLALLFLFGINIFLEMARGKKHVERWVGFSLDFGLSYIGWTFLILFLSCYPTYVLWQSAVYLMPAASYSFAVLYFLGQYLVFPILFLSVIETETFLRGFPRRTFDALLHRPWLWLSFYVRALPVVGLPTLLAGTLIFLGSRFEDYWIAQSFFYTIIASLLFTLAGFAVLAYFRLLGQLAWQSETLPDI